MQEKLFNIKPIRLPRPTHDSVDFSDVYEKLADIILDWDKHAVDSKEELVESLKTEITVRQLRYEDGYKLGRILEDKFNYDVDFNLAEDLDAVSHFVYTTMQEAYEKWVEDCEIKPKYSIKDEVMVEVKNVKYIGRVVEIYYKKAEYSIYIEELHKGTNTIGTIKKFEEIEEDFFDEKHWTE